MRKAGFELEYGGLTLEESGRIVRRVFGGEHRIDSTFEHRVVSGCGTFTVEIDTSVLKDRRYERPLRELGFDVAAMDLRWLEEVLLDVARTIVPVEIGTPPLPVTELRPMEQLRSALRAAGARGTRAGLLYAFGLHINAELPDAEPGTILDTLRAFILLYPWLRAEGQIDVARALTPYIDRFPAEYAQLVLRADYSPSLGAFIDDYVTWNSTRNRGLDLLPALAHLDGRRVLAGVQDPQLIKPRPAFHYRLPNCMVDEVDWSLADEWNRWVAVERLAEDKVKLARMSADYLAAEAESFRPFYDKWPEVMEVYLKG